MNWVQRLVHRHSWLHHPQIPGREYYCWTCGAYRAETDPIKQAADFAEWERARNDFYVSHGFPRWWLGDGR